MKELLLNDGIIIGGNRRVFIIAEIGLCHDGDPEVARTLIAQCKEAGADAVKFQKRDVANLAIGEVLDAKDDRFPHFGSTYRQIREHIEFDVRTYHDLKKYADEIGIPFIVSVFDNTSTDEMLPLRCSALKLASHVLSRKPLIEHICQLTEKIPILLSTGMAHLEEIDETVAMFKQAGVPFGLFHCVSIYPHRMDQANLKMIRFLSERYDVPVGYSCHEIENTSSLLAIAAGAVSLERHVTLNRDRVGFDHKIALDMKGLAQLVTEVRAVEAAMGSSEKTVSEDEWITRRKYHSSVVSFRTIKAGEIISRDMLTAKNPGTGISARKIDEVVGKKALVDIAQDILLLPKMLG
jgi:sialic acid synthase SpsE